MERKFENAGTFQFDISEMSRYVMENSATFGVDLFEMKLCTISNQYFFHLKIDGNSKGKETINQNVK